MAILARPVCALLWRPAGCGDYGNCRILTVLSISGISDPVQTLTAILQGLNRMTVPVRNLAIGAMFKIALTWYLIGIPEINVKGAAVGTIVCYGVAALLDLTAVIRYSGIRMRFGDFILKPVVAVFIMSLLVYFSYGYLNTVFGSNKAVLLAISLGVIVYAVVLLAVGAVNQADLEMLPGGVKLGRVLSRLKLIR